MININRLHPLLVHLPIGILFFASFLYLVKKWKKTNDYDAAIYLALVTACGAAIFSSGTGWLLSNEGGYDTDLIFWHKWCGIATTVTIFSMVILYKQAVLAKKYLGILFLLAMGLLAATGHHGGSLTHGSEYLFESAVSDDVNSVAGKKPEELSVYQDIISPILQKKCINCHKASKKKGELIMTSFSTLMKGGKSGLIINTENPHQSEMLKRISLPVSEKKHMPPKGKIQITDDEFTLLTWWLENKACENCLVKEMEGREKVNPILEKYVQPTSSLNLARLAPLSDKQITSLQQNGIKISSITADNPLVSLSIQNENNISNSMLKSMKPIRNNIQELNLSSSTINKSLIDFILTLTNLQKLQLQYSTISDQDISKFKDLENLQILNLYSTSISDKSIEVIANIPNLEKVFIWQSNISPEGVAALEKEKPLLKIHHGIDPAIFGKASLKPPMIIADTDLFDDSLMVTLKSNLKNTHLYYTLDGSPPDTNSMIYTAPLTFKKSQKIKTIASKKNWGTSEISSKQFIQKKHEIKNITLSKSPSPNYPGRGPTTLIDQIKSGMDFRNGQWLGFEGTDVTATLTLAKEETINSLFISSFSDPNSWIHYPKGAVVSVSTNGKDYQEVQEKTIDKDHRDGVEMAYFDLLFEPITCKFVKVEIKSLLKNPAWHPSPGGAAWLFIDEILIN